jgi:hypothetical protein
MGRPIPAELDCAHLAAQIALSNGLDLNVGGKLHISTQHSTISYQPPADG